MFAERLTHAVVSPGAGNKKAPWPVLPVYVKTVPLPRRGRRAMCLHAASSLAHVDRERKYWSITMNELLTTEDINHLNAQNADLRAENARLRVALLFYADGIRPLLDAQTNTYQYIAPDDGHIARDALAGEGDDA